MALDRSVDFSLFAFNVKHVIEKKKKKIILLTPHLGSDASEFKPMCNPANF